MTQQKVIRWQPLADIPETPLENFLIESLQVNHLRLVLKYSPIPGNDDRDLEIEFLEAMALRTHWEGDAPVVGRLSDVPHCEHSKFSIYCWPLLILENSQWVASGDFDSSRFIAEATHLEPWRHFAVLSRERSIDIIARGKISAKWVPSKVAAERFRS